MIDLATSPSRQRDDIDVINTTEPGQPSTLITQHRVLLGSAAALAGPAVRRHRVRDAVRAWFASAGKSETPGRSSRPKHYPRHYRFIEDAAMSRMMDRL